MTQQPLVSIIIPTYNRANLIGETLDSVLAQTYQNWECIIVDDGSSDNTDEVVGSYVKSDTRFHYYHRPADRPKGANACRNYGFKVSEGEYVLFLDSDDLLAKTCIENRMRLFLSNPHLDFVVSDTGQFKDGNFSNQSINNDLLVKNCYEYALLFFCYKLPWTIMSVLWKRNMLKGYSFDESLFRFQDVDFHIQILYGNEFQFERLFEIDNYYRHAATEKNEGDVHAIKLANSLLILIDKIAEFTRKDIKIRKAFKRFLYVISRDFIFFNNHTDLKIVDQFYKKIKQHTLLDFRDRIHFRILYLYKLTNTFNKKGFGVLKFRKYANQYYNRVYTLKNGN